MRQELTTIPLSKETRDDLKMCGYKEETYDEILQRLIELARRQVFYDRQKQILEEEEFTALEDI